MSDPKSTDQNDSGKKDADELPDGSGPSSETSTGGDGDQFQG